MAQLGRALRSGRRGRRFKSCYPDYYDGALVELVDTLVSGTSGRKPVQVRLLYALYEKANTFKDENHR